MKSLLPITGTMALVLLSGEALRTEYTPGKKLVVERETRFSMKTTHSSFERDGQEVDRGGRGFNMDVETHKRVVYVDLVQEVEGGSPVKLERTFETLEGEAVLGEQDVALDAPLAGLKLLLSTADGEVEAELEEGSVEDDEVLEGHAMTLPLDALLPAGEVAPGDEWELEDGDALLSALGLDLDPKYFLPPRFEFGGFGGGEGRGGRGGGRGGMRRGGGDQRVFHEADWEVTLTLLAEAEELEGEEVLAVKLVAEGSGELPEPERGFGRGRREFSTSATVVPSARGTEFEIELAGRLLFSKASHRPVRLEIEGEVRIETDREFSRGESSMRMQRSQEGTFEQTVTITER